MRQSIKAIEVVLLSAVFALSGCATVYHTPPQSASLAERQQVYDRQKATYDWFNYVRVGGRQLPLGGHSYAISVAKYYEAGGDTLSAKMAADAAPHYAWGLAAGLAGLLGGIAVQSSQGWQDLRWLCIGGALGIGVEITVINFGNERYIRPSVASYNSYLRRDLALDGPEP